MCSNGNGTAATEKNTNSQNSEKVCVTLFAPFLLHSLFRLNVRQRGSNVVWLCVLRMSVCIHSWFMRCDYEFVCPTNQYFIDIIRSRSLPLPFSLLLSRNILSFFSLSWCFSRACVCVCIRWCYCYYWFGIVFRFRIFALVHIGCCRYLHINVLHSMPLQLNLYFLFSCFFSSSWILTIKHEENKLMLSILCIAIWISDVSDNLKIYFFSLVWVARLSLCVKCDKAARSSSASWFLVTRLFNIRMSIRTRQFLWH